MDYIVRRLQDLGIISMTAASCIAILFVTGAHAESSLLLQLNEQLNHESKQVQSGLVELKSTSSHQQSAHQWAEKLRALPKDSKDYAYARAEYARAVASDLEQKFATVSKIEQAATSMTETIDRLTAAYKRENRGSNSLFSQSDSAESIRTKANQLAGLNNMFVSLVRSDDTSMKSSRLRQAYKVYQLQWQTVKLQSSIPRGQGIDSLQNLKDSSEGMAFLARAYLNGLKQQAEAIQMVSVGGEASLINRTALKVLNGGFDDFNPDSQGMQDMQMMLTSIDDAESSSGYQGGANPEISNEIGAFADRFIAERQ